jgi:hypothetical protein
MKIFIYEDKYKYVAEPYFLEAFSNLGQTVLFVPESGEWLLNNEECEKIRFPQDIQKLDLAGDFNSKWDYSILPDHGIDDYLNPNIYSSSRKGRLYQKINKEYISRELPEKYRKIPVFEREQKNLKKDMEIFEIKFNVKNFKYLF